MAARLCLLSSTVVTNGDPVNFLNKFPGVDNRLINCSLERFAIEPVLMNLFGCCEYSVFTIIYDIFPRVEQKEKRETKPPSFIGHVYSFFRQKNP